jgi:pimeloyl-ACP methyl ester carboxylesterase
LVRLSAPTKPALSNRIAKWLNRVGMLSDATMEARRRAAGSADYNAAQGIMRDIMVKTVNETYDDDLAAINCPTWMVWGENDTAAPTAAGKVASERIHGAMWRVVPGEAHLLTPTLGAAVRTAIEAAL